MVRQMRGLLENRAISDIIYRLGYVGLPPRADDMVLQYIAKHGVPRIRISQRPLMALAIRELRSGVPANDASCEVVCTYSSAVDNPEIAAVERGLTSTARTVPVSSRN